jgi:predicted acyltransferase
MEPERKERPREGRAAPVSAVPLSTLDAKRLASLDAFRGLAVFGMLLVNNKQLGPWTPDQLHHARWGHPVHFADMVFPWFLLIVGVAIPFAAASARRRGFSRWAFARKIGTRALLLVLIGVLINSSFVHHPLFDLGVLQTIGLAYLAGALLYRLRPRWRLQAIAILLVGQWAVLRHVAAPGIAAGVVTEKLNLIRYVNETYLAAVGLENLPAIAPTTALVLMGTFAGDLVRRGAGDPVHKARLLAAAGLGLLLLGALWSLDLPMVKRIWTASYVTFAAGAGLLVFALFYWAIDVRGRVSWSFPLVVFGANAITAFALPILANVHILDEWTARLPNGLPGTLRQSLLQAFTARFGPGPGGLAFTLAFLLFWWLVLYGLYRKRIFIRV